MPLTKRIALLIAIGCLYTLLQVQVLAESEATAAFVRQRTRDFIGVQNDENDPRSHDNNLFEEVTTTSSTSMSQDAVDVVDSEGTDINFVVNQEKPDQLIPCDFIAETSLPTDVGHFRLRAYRVSSRDDFDLDTLPEFMGREPCVIYCADRTSKVRDGSDNDDSSLEEAVPVRVHDQCFTSEVMYSNRCDCKEQLLMALKYIQKHGGAVIYLQQEGRGIGLANKISAYALQDEGMDTVEANLHLGLPEDGREYGVIPDILKDMGIASIRLITNNPRKVSRLLGVGVNVVGTIPVVVPNANEYNRRYLETKVKKMDHQNFGNLFDVDESTFKERKAFASPTAPKKGSFQSGNGRSYQ